MNGRTACMRNISCCLYSRSFHHWSYLSYHTLKMYINSSLFIVTTFLAIFGAFSQIIVKYVLSIFVQESTHSREVRTEIAKLRTEMSKVSMIDEFARHARLQRKLIKLQDELKTEKVSLSTSKLKYKFLISLAVSVISGFCMLFMLYYYRSEAILILPENWLSPFGSIISWPSSEIGAVSVLSWITVCGAVSRLIAGKLS